MQDNTRTNWGGSVATFVIVGLVLAAVVIGGVYLVRQRGVDTRSQAPVMENPSDDNNKNPAPSTPAPSDDKSETKPEAKPAPSPAPTPSTTPQTGVDQPAPAPTSPSTHLPQTGPADTLMQLVVIGALVASVWTYLRSYKHRFGSLLK